MMIHVREMTRPTSRCNIKSSTTSAKSTTTLLSGTSSQVLTSQSLQHHPSVLVSMSLMIMLPPILLLLLLLLSINSMMLLPTVNGEAAAASSASFVSSFSNHGRNAFTKSTATLTSHCTTNNCPSRHSQPKLKSALNLYPFYYSSSSSSSSSSLGIMHPSNNNNEPNKSASSFAGKRRNHLSYYFMHNKKSHLPLWSNNSNNNNNGSNEDEEDGSDTTGGYYYDDFSEPIGDASQSSILQGFAEQQQKQQQQSSVTSTDNDEIPQPPQPQAIADNDVELPDFEDEDELPDFDDSDDEIEDAGIPEEEFDIDNDNNENYYNDDENNDENNTNDTPPPVKNPKELITIPLPQTISPKDDLTGATARQFSLGPDLLLSSYAGSLGFDQVTDWQYYSTDPSSGERTPVSPRPLDPSQPSRTRSSSGSVVRLFRGEMMGQWGSKIRSMGLDSRVWMKEYYGEDALKLARQERRSVGRLQSRWLKNYLTTKSGGGTGNIGNGGTTAEMELLKKMEDGTWMEVAQRRYVDGLTNTPTKQDDDHLASFSKLLLSQKAPFTALLGEMNLNDYYDDESIDPNAWYKSLGVKPPQPGSVWLVFDYHGLSTAASYAVPAIIQRNKLPPKRGPFGGPIAAPPLPSFRDRARYMVKGVLKGMVNAVACAHEAGIVHRSIGRNSFLLSSVGQDKREATSPYAVVVERLRVILSDWGFSATFEEAIREKEFGQRSRVFGIPAVDAMSSESEIEFAMEFAKAEDLHALGFVFLAMLFTTLADPATLSAPIPLNDDDTWQRLFSEIFEKDMTEFRDYCTNEDVWNSVVELLDREEGAGWEVLGDLLLARERVSEMWKSEGEDGDGLVQASELRSNRFFKMV